MLDPALPLSRMHKHLRAWRKARKMTQEQAANALDVVHTTIGRWERGQMKLSTADLESLAKLYGVTMTQLMAPPAAADMVARLDRAQAIIEHMDAITLEHWLALGETLKKRD